MAVVLLVFLSSPYLSSMFQRNLESAISFNPYADMEKEDVPSTPLPPTLCSFVLLCKKHSWPFFIMGQIFLWVSSSCRLFVHTDGKLMWIGSHFLQSMLRLIWSTAKEVVKAIHPSPQQLSLNLLICCSQLLSRQDSSHNYRIPNWLKLDILSVFTANSVEMKAGRLLGCLGRNILIIL